MANKYIENTSKILLDKSKVVMKDICCFAFWGEPKLPDILKKEYETKETEQDKK